jgi:3alpha(or 20beta)-hydroxysteroid dehydrogenase
MGRLEGRVAIITGAARGMGEGIAKRFVQEGARVLLTDITEEQGQDLATSLGPNAAFATLDVRDEAAWSRVAGEAVDRWGSLDVLVNNAGIAQLALLADMSLDDYRRVVEVNQFGVFLGMRACIPAMKRTGKGSIVNNSSVGGLFGNAAFGAYNASKHAVIGMTRTAAVELARYNIRANAVCPGGIDTPMGASTPGGEMIDVDAHVTHQYPLGRMGTTDEVGSLFCFLASDESSYITGVAIPIDGGWTAGYQIPLKPEYQ